MSAYVVSKAHIDVLVRAICVHERELRWFRDPVKHEEYAKPDPMGRGSDNPHIEAVGPTEIGRILWTENVRSVYARYPDTVEGGSVPGPAGFDPRSELILYRYEYPGFTPTPVEIFKALAGYEYQSCEHEGWRSSEAFDLCDSLRNCTIHRLPGWDAAEWSWDAESVAARIQLASLSGRRAAQEAANGG